MDTNHEEPLTWYGKRKGGEGGGSKNPVEIRELSNLSYFAITLRS